MHLLPPLKIVAIIKMFEWITKILKVNFMQTTLSGEINNFEAELGFLSVFNHSPKHSKSSVPKYYKIGLLVCVERTSRSFAVRTHSLYQQNIET